MLQDLIFDWNRESSMKFPKAVEVCDETLRDGIQSPSVFDPEIEDKLDLVALMEKLGITIANIGLPGAGLRAYNDVLAIAKFVRDEKFKLQLNCAARTVAQDIEPIARIQQIVGVPIVAYCFLGASPIRQLVENWGIDRLKRTTDDAITFAKKEGLKVAFVTEDTTRSDPKTLDILFRHAISLGSERLVLCDTVGHATPLGIKSLVDFTKNVIKASGQQIFIDWHGHNDRGLSLANALFAAEYGCDRIHGTALGLGERAGNTAIDQLIVNLKLLDAYHHDVSSLVAYVEKAARACHVPIPFNYPLCGSDAFRTATGVHAAAVIKAKDKGDQLLADIIYSGVPAYWFGKEQKIDIGPMSGASNVKAWLRDNQIAPTEGLVSSLLEFAKTQSYVLSDQEIFSFLETLKKASECPLPSPAPRV